MVRRRFRIVRGFFARIAVSVTWWEFVLPRVGLRRVAERTRAKRMRGVASSFRALAVRMGGVLIKVGQFLSSRLDVLPKEIIAELQGLQDEVGAESFDDVRRVIEEEFGAPLGERFASLDPVPIASASIGQAHRARLCVTAPDGTPCPSVVVKVQRHDIGGIIEADLAAIRQAGKWLMRSKTVRRHMNVPALIEEFARSLAEETDYLAEGRSAERFARNFAAQPDVRVPSVVWSHTTRRVLTLEDVGSIKITDYPAIEAAGIARRAVASRLMSTYLKQIFEDGFFHADPHPGNLFVLPAPTAADPGAFKLVFVDFGMTGALEQSVFTGLREVLLATGTRDGGRLVAAFQTLGFLLPGADLKLIERASQKVLEKVWGRSATEMLRLRPEDFSSLADEFSALLYDMPFQLPENMILLGRCVGILSGMATGLDQSYNPWATLAPYVGKLVDADGKGGLRSVFGEVTGVLRILAGLPRRAETVLDRIEEGRMDVRLPEMRQQVVRLERGLRKLGGAVIFAAGLIAGTSMFVAGHLEIAAGFAAAEGLLLLWLLLAR